MLAQSGGWDVFGKKWHAAGKAEERAESERSEGSEASAMEREVRGKARGGTEAEARRSWEREMTGEARERRERKRGGEKGRGLEVGREGGVEGQGEFPDVCSPPVCGVHSALATRGRGGSVSMSSKRLRAWLLADTQHGIGRLICS